MYNYQQNRSFVFTEEGQVMFLKVRDKVFKALQETGAITVGKAITGLCGDSFNMLACVDRVVELDEVQIVERGWTQNNIIVVHRKHLHG